MKAKLAYIVSVGHSGSTLLDMLSGSIPGCFSTGELNHLRWQLARRQLGDTEESEQTLCSCGEKLQACKVWKKILTAVGHEIGADILADPLQLDMNLLQNENYFGQNLSTERIHRAIYGFACRYSALSPVTNQYEQSLRVAVKNNWSIFDCAAEQTNSEVIVDSSKSALRLRLLHRHRPESTYILVLMRDIRGVSYSQQKRGFDPIAAARGWVAQYNRIYSILNTLKNPMILGIRYEELAENPTAVRQRIASFLRLGNIPADYEIDTLNLHLVAGNRIRYSGKISIRPDTGWKDGLDQQTLREIDRIRGTLNPAWEQFF